MPLKHPPSFLLAPRREYLRDGDDKLERLKVTADSLEHLVYTRELHLGRQFYHRGMTVRSVLFVLVRDHRDNFALRIGKI